MALLFARTVLSCRLAALTRQLTFRRPAAAFGRLHTVHAPELNPISLYSTGTGPRSAASVRTGGRRSAVRPQQAARRFNAGSSRDEPKEGYYFATCHPGLEAVVAAELSSSNIGARDVRTGQAGVYFRGEDPLTGYSANLWLRAAIRVLQLLAMDELDPNQQGGVELYRATREAADWTRLLRPGQSFSVDARVGQCSDMPSEMLARIRVKDAICDAIVDSGRQKPMPPEPGVPSELPLFVSCFQDRVLIYRDLSGTSLHRRGWRSAMHRASLNESAAAGVLYMAGWDQMVAQNPGAVIADPMCGSATLLIEAADMATNFAPGLRRAAWPFQQWPDFMPRAWSAAVRSAEAAQRGWTGAALGNDNHPGALELASRDAQSAYVDSYIGLRHGSAASWQLERAPDLTVVNPPWGQRLGDSGFEEDTADLEQSYEELQTFFKGQCNETSVYVLSGAGSKYATRHIGMKADWKKPISIGGVDTRLLKYSVLPKLAKTAAA